MKIRDKKDFDEINVFGQGEPNDGFAQYFSGESFLNVLNNSQEHGGIFAANGISTMQRPAAGRC